jgi:SAM-dependent methyltransferase
VLIAGVKARDRILAAVERNDDCAALALVLERHARHVLALRRRGIDPTFRQFLRYDTLTVLTILTESFGFRHLLDRIPLQVVHRLLVAIQFNLYMRHRFSMPSFLAALPLLGLADGTSGLVMDTACGMGHLASTIAKIVPPQRLLCMDLNPSFAWSTRTFFAPDAHAAIAHDLNRPLPISSGQFSTIFCSDAFHYVTHKAQLARDFLRLLRDDGILVMPHLHNRLQFNPSAGDPLSPAEYAALFEGAHVRVFPEDHLIDTYINDLPLDLEEHYGEQNLDAAPALVLVAAKSADTLRVVPSVREKLFDRVTTPRINSLYRTKRHGDRLLLTRRVPEALAAEYPRLLELLPKQVIIDASRLTGRDGQAEVAAVRDLLRQHVLLDVPARY